MKKASFKEVKSTILGLPREPMSDLLTTHISLLDACCAMMLWFESTLHILHPSTHHESNLSLKSASLHLDIHFCKHTNHSIKEGCLFFTLGSSKP